MISIRRTFLGLALALLPGLALADGPAPPPRVALGVNLSWQNYYTSQIPFCDAMANSSGFVVAPPGVAPWTGPADLPALALDGDGFPKTALPYVHTDGKSYVARSCAFLHNGKQYPVGTYTLSFDGAGTVAVRPDDASPTASFSQDGTPTTKVPHPVAVAGTSNFGIIVWITRSDPANPVKNVRLILPGLAEASGYSRWNPDFLNRLQGVRTIRFKDFQQTDGTSVARWADRTTATAATQGGPNGVAIEHCIDLCNRVGAEPWLCVPPSAGPDYSAGMASLVQAQLRPDLKVHVEYGNELWNWGRPFVANWQRVDTWGKANALGHFQAAAALAKAAWKPWTDTLGYDRVVRVCAGQFGGPSTVDQMATYLVAHADPGDPNWGFDALSVAPYYGTGQAPTYTAATTAHQIAADAIGGASSDKLKVQIAACVAVRDKWAKTLGRRIPLLCYEGGFSIVPNNAPWQQAAFDSGADGAMYAADRVYYETLAGAGIDGLCIFDFIDPPSVNGTYGILPSQGSPATPRWNALMDYLRGK